MRRLILCVIALIAIFSIIRAYTQEGKRPASRSVTLSPGVFEVAGEGGSISIGFGLMGGEASADGRWNVLPIRIVYASGGTRVSIGLNGLSFLLSEGVRIGVPVVVDGPRTGDIVSVGGNVAVYERVEGDVWAFGADIVLGPRASVSGNVVAIGGKIAADPRARAGGTVSALPGLKLPFIRLLATKASAPIVELVREFLLFLLAALALFLASYFLTPRMLGILRASTSQWRRSLLTIALSLILLPLFVLLLVVSVFGIVFLPFLLMAVLLAAFLGFFAFIARFGAWMRRGSEDSAIFLFTSGILGLFVIKAPAFAGICLALLRSNTAQAVGHWLRVASLAVSLAFIVYGYGVSLSHARLTALGQKA